MVRIGKKSVLEVVKFTEQGAYLDGGPYGEILLPRRYVSDSLSEEDEIEVFISFDSEDRLVATTDFPTIMVDEFGALNVIDVNRFGAFLDWGLPKDLFVPFAEQAVRMEKGQKYVVRAFVDPKSGRILASSKFNKFLSKEESDLQIGDKVELLITTATDLGFKAIINNTYSGLLFHNELFKPIEIGDRMPGYVKNIRPDGKIDLSLEKQGYQRIDPVADSIMEKLKQSGGVLNLSDKSDPEQIKHELGISKKAFKQAIGALYKKKLIVIEAETIRLA
ncbi:MAG: GntR family transcriptional regulator [Prolixibacteraceae bacterium]|jgi:hypothetical protein|nr:GntR family transcriptional regulator [Prolixibacteraceae bacterium]